MKQKNSFRNLNSVRAASDHLYDRCYSQGLLGRYLTATDNRRMVDPVTHEEFVDFSRCSYLGLDSDERLLVGAKAALDRVGSTQWSCARTRLNYALLGELEEVLSVVFSSTTTCFSSVTQANISILPLVAAGFFTENKRPIVVFDQRCHASMAYSKPVVADETDVITLPHNDLGALEDICKRGQQVAYIADGVYSMGGYSPIERLSGLIDRYGLLVYIDDAHGVSIVGEHGQGFARTMFGTEMPDRLIITCSLSKGFGASGAVALTRNKDYTSIIRRYALSFAFANLPMVPAVGASLSSASIHLTDEIYVLQDRLRERIELFDSLVTTAEERNGLPIKMFVVGDETDTITLCRRLLTSGLYTSATFFPTVARGHAALRVCLTSDHSLDDVRRLAIELSHYEAQARANHDFSDTGPAGIPENLPTFA